MMPEKSTDLDVLIIGGGPAGIAASYWCTHLGMTSLLIEQKPELGGQLLWTHNPIKNYLGVEAANGREFRERLFENDPRLLSRSLVNLNIDKIDIDRRFIKMADGRHLTARAMILATGVRRRKLEVPGEASFAGKGLLNSGAGSKNDVAGRIVTIVGGGDAAFENALILGKSAKQINLLHRRAEFTARHEFVDAVKQLPNIRIRKCCRLIKIEGSDRVETVEIIDLAKNIHLTIPTDAVLVRIGVRPNSEIVKDKLLLDSNGYITANRNLQTNIDNVYAIGDVANPLGPTISGAIGDGSTAVKHIYVNLNKCQV